MLFGCILAYGEYFILIISEVIRGVVAESNGKADQLYPQLYLQQTPNILELNAQSNQRAKAEGASDALLVLDHLAQSEMSFED
jgi:hypothetical protein